MRPIVRACVDAAGVHVRVRARACMRVRRNEGRHACVKRKATECRCCAAVVAICCARVLQPSVLRYGNVGTGGGVQRSGEERRHQKVHDRIPPGQTNEEINTQITAGYTRRAGGGVIEHATIVSESAWDPNPLQRASARAWVHVRAWVDVVRAYGEIVERASKGTNGEPINYPKK